MTSMIKQFATAARDHGLHPLPCNADKAPAISRKETEDRPQTLEEIERWTSPMVALVCGNDVNPVLAIDFDQAGLFFEAYKARVQAERPELWDRLTVEKTMNDGAHIWIRTKRPYMTQKLAHNVIEVEGPGEFPSCGKDYKAFEYRGKWVINPDAIETRGATKGLGAYCVCSPSPGYELLQGKILSMPLLDDEEVDFLLSVAREFETYFPEPKKPKVKPEARPAEGDRPGDDFNARGEILPILEKHDWTFVKQVGDRIHLARPGKTGCTSATLTADRVFYPFSSNSLPFEPNEAYAPFSVYAMLEHDGDFAAAAKDLAAQGYGAGESDWNPDGGQRAGNPKEQQDHVLGTIFNAVDLLDMSLPELNWAVPGLLPQGLAILAGGPKLGKSWLIYRMLMDLARGVKILDHFDPGSGRALYLALEDSKRRLQDRLKALCKGVRGVRNGLERLDIQTSWPCIDEGGLDLLETYIKTNLCHGLKLVIIDTWAKIGPKQKAKGLNAYEADSKTMGFIKKLADQYSICILLVTHLSKTVHGKDPFDAITGSQGQFGSADTALLLSRSRNKDTATLLTTGRDIDGASYLLQWAKPGWTCIGESQGNIATQSPERQEIVDLLGREKRAMTPKEVADALGKNHSTIKNHLKKMFDDDFLIKVGTGRYAVSFDHAGEFDFRESVDSVDRVDFIDGVDSVGFDSGSTAYGNETAMFAGSTESTSLQEKRDLPEWAKPSPQFVEGEI